MYKETFKKLCMSFDKKPNQELYEYWDEILEDYDPYFIDIAINNIIKNDKFFPTIARIIEEIQNTPYEEISTEEKRRRMKEKGINPEWVDKVIENEEVEQNDIDTFNEFKSFLEGLKNG